MIETRRNSSHLRKKEKKEWMNKIDWKKEVEKKIRERLKKNVKETGPTSAVSNNYAHSDDQSIKNMNIQGKHFQKEKF